MTWVGTVTKWLILVAVVGLATWTSIAVVIGGQQDSVSAHVRDYCIQYPVLTLAVGFLLGHWFWSQTPARPRPKLLPLPDPPKDDPPQA